MRRRRRDNNDIDGGVPRRVPDPKAEEAQRRIDAALDVLRVIANLGPGEGLPADPAPAFVEGLAVARRMGYFDGPTITAKGRAVYRRNRLAELPARAVPNDPEHS